MQYPLKTASDNQVAVIQTDHNFYFKQFSNPFDKGKTFHDHSAFVNDDTKSLNSSRVVQTPTSNKKVSLTCL